MDSSGIKDYFIILEILQTDSMEILNRMYDELLLSFIFSHLRYIVMQQLCDSSY